MGWDQDEEVDIAQRAKLRAAIATRRHQRQARRGRSRAEVQGVDDDINRIGTKFGDLITRNTRPMRGQLNLPSFLEKSLGPRDDRPLQRRLPGQPMLQGGVPETSGGGFKFRRHRWARAW